MNWLAISQRVNVNIPHERYDAVDQRWSAVAIELDFMPIHLPNIFAGYVPALIDRLKPSAILLTGGNSLCVNEKDAPDAALERDLFEHALLREAIAQRIPVVGICRGMQLINDYYGGVLQRVPDHAGTEHHVTFQGELETLGTVHVKSYHHWGITLSNLAIGLNALATAEDGTIEAVKHKTDNVTGIMWHPEREKCLTVHDKLILQGALT